MARIIRGTGIVTINKMVRITGTGNLAANLLQLFGTVKVLEQYAILMSKVSLLNATNVYATLFSAGSPELDLTADGAVLSGAPVGTFFTKDQGTAEQYSVLMSDVPRLSESKGADDTAGIPFTVQQQNGADTFLRFYLATTDAPVDFTMFVEFTYKRFNGSRLVFL